MLKYGMVGVLGSVDGLVDVGPSRVVVWTFDRPGLYFSTTEEEIQSFVSSFRLALNAVDLKQFEYWFEDEGSHHKKVHQFNVSEHCMVYHFDSGELVRVPVMDVYLRFTRAI
jgi:hypothetical protein